MKKIGSFRNKTIVITGATEGIGAAIATEFAIQGANIFLIGRDQKKLEKFHDILSKEYPESRVGVLSTDTGSYTQVKTTVKSIIRMVSRIDGLVNNAGFHAPGYFENTSVETFEKMNSTKYMGAVYFTKELVPHMNEGGFISFTAGVTGYLPLFGYSATVGSDFALFGFAQTLLQELVPRNISVHVLIPPVTDTPGYRQSAAAPPESGRFGRPGKPFQASEVAACFIRDLLKRKFFMFVDFQSKLYYHLKGMFPWLMMRIMMRKTAAARKNKAIHNETSL